VPVDQIIVPINFNLRGPQIDPITLKAGQDRAILFQLRQEDGTKLDCSSCVYSMTVKISPFLKRIILAFSGPDFDITDEEDGDVVLNISGSLLDIEPRAYFAELQVTFPVEGVFKSKTFGFTVLAALTA